MLAGSSSYPVIAVVANRYSDFRRPVIEHISRLLEPHGFGVLCIAGGELQADNGECSATLQTCNGIYAEAANFNIKGYLFISVTLGYHADSEQIFQLIHQFRHRPVVSFGLRVPEIPSIAINNTLGMRSLMQHMMQDQRRKRFVFLRGYPKMTDSIQREATFRTELARAGLSVDEQLIITGNFLTADSFAAMESLLARTRNFDAVIAANDIMAVSAIQALNKHGLRVPEDVIVAGFDDRPEASSCVPPITSVRYPFEENTVVAVQALLDMIENPEQSTPCLELPSSQAQLVVRDSSTLSLTHLVEQELQDSVPSNLPITRDPLDGEPGTFNPQSLREDLIQCLTSSQAPDSLIITEFVDHLLGVLLNASTHAYRQIQTSLYAIHANPESTSWWSQLAYRLQGPLQRNHYLPDSPAAQHLFTSLFIQVQSAVSSVREKQQFDIVKYLQLQDKLHIELTSSSSTVGIFKALDTVFSQMGVHRAFVVLYEKPSRDPGTTGRVHYTYPTSNHDQDAQLFDTCEILPEPCNKTLATGLMVLSPLCTRYENFGYLLIDPSGIAPLNIENLCNTLSNALRSCHRTSELQAQARKLISTNNELTVLANYDPLTELCNRTRFTRVLNAAFTEADETGDSVQVLFLDLDGFKMVNDTLGHSVGDQLLVNVAHRLNVQLSSIDTVARLGGDEFALCVSNIDASALAGRILESLKRAYVLGEHKISLTASIGIASYPEHGRTVDTVLKHADTAMYHAKSHGKNRFSIFDPSMNQDAQARITIDQAMREGLKNGEFDVHYQPRVTLDTGQVVAFEALVRWIPTDASIQACYTNPDVFIALAEQTGFVIEIDEFVFERACGKLKDWHARGHRVVMSVNLSIARLQQDQIAQKIMSRLQHHEVDPRYMELEITEHAAMTDVQQNIKTLTELQATGMRLSIDDFGTGYSSLNYLKQLPVSSLKIDKSFLQSIQSADEMDSADAAIVRAIVALSRSMDYTVVAEGVELQAQHDFLNALACDEAQGYLYSKALDEKAADQFINSQLTLERSRIA